MYSLSYSDVQIAPVQTKESTILLDTSYSERRGDYQACMSNVKCLRSEDVAGF